MRSCARYFPSAARRFADNASMKIVRPAATEYDAAFERYVSRVPESDALPALERQPGELRAVVGSLSPERAGFRYAPGKWSVRELVGHVTDSERIFGYRALCVARGEAAPLPGFEQGLLGARDPVGVPQLRIHSLVVRCIRHRGAEPGRVVHVLRRCLPEPGDQRVPAAPLLAGGAQLRQPGRQGCIHGQHPEHLGDTACRAQGGREGRTR